MAGNYPDVPSWRMAWDRDGTQAFTIDTAGTPTPLTSVQARNLNSESFLDMAMSSGHWLALIFPEPRDIDAYFVSYYIWSGYNADTVQVSTDTTNGVDGTWTNYTAPPTNVPSPSKVQARNELKTGTAFSCRGIRIRANGNGYWRAFHVYGEIVPGGNPDRLSLWHPTLDEHVAPEYFDFGNIARASSESKTFRVKNLSSTLTATSVRVAMEALTDTAPSFASQLELSLDGASYLAQVNVGDLAPGVISQVITCRAGLQADAIMGLWWLRIFSEATSWV